LSIDATTGKESEMGNLLTNYHSKKNDKVIKQNISSDRFNIWSFSSIQSEKRFLFSSHIDTVPPHLDWKFDLESQTYFGRGACDTKGGIISMLMAAEELRTDGIAIDFLWVIGEETDHIGAKNAFPYYKENYQSLYKYQSIFLCEPTDNRLATAQKGIAKAKLSFMGTMAHSGYPHLGKDANKLLVETASKIYNIAAQFSDEKYGALDVNIGLIIGGRAANVISDKAEITFLARTNSYHFKFIDEVNLLISDNIKIEWQTLNEATLFPHVEKLNYSNTYVAKFNTDAAYLGSIAPIYLMGPGYIIHAHAPNEHILVEEIINGAKLYQKLIRDIINVI
jgi:acetylornithine deacetylase